MLGLSYQLHKVSGLGSYPNFNSLGSQVLGLIQQQALRSRVLGGLGFHLNFKGLSSRFLPKDRVSGLPSWVSLKVPSLGSHFNYMLNCTVEKTNCIMPVHLRRRVLRTLSKV